MSFPTLSNDCEEQGLAYDIGSYVNSYAETHAIARTRLASINA